MNWRLNNVLAATGGRLICGPSEARFDGIGIDSRTAAPGQLFVAICGDRFDAHDFIDEVVDKGVRGLVVAQSRNDALDPDALSARGVACVAVEDTTRALGALAAFQRRQHRIPVVAITGSNGKTTSRQMTQRVMAQGFNTLATQGNFNNEIGLPLTLFNLSAAHEAAVLELGMNHVGEIDRLGAICRPTIGLITNVGPAHLEFLESIDGVARAKAELLPHIAADGHAILNRDDERVAGLADKAPFPVTFFGLSDDAHVRATSLQDTAVGVDFELILSGQRTWVQLKTPGRFMVYNALAAAAVGYAAGLTIEQVKAGLESFTPQVGRLQLLRTSGGLNIIDDTYNANPASMAAAIDTFRRHRGSSGGYLVLGDMLELGARAGALHETLGGYAADAEPARLYAYGEYAPQVIAGAQKRQMPADDLFAGTKEEIAVDLATRLKPGDWLLVKGSRGMTMETVVKALLGWAQDATGTAPGRNS